MRIRFRLLVAVFAGIAAMCEPAFAIGARGGGMPGGGGGGARPGGMAGGGGRPQMPSRPPGGGGFSGSMGHMGGGGGGGGRPNFNMPSGGGGNFNRPNINRPPSGGANFNRPNMGGGANINRPPTGLGNTGGNNFNRPGGANINKPHGAMKPSLTLPNTGTKPTPRPGNLPGNSGIVPGNTAGKPSTRPGSLPSLDGPKLPGKNPGNPISGGNRPTTRPGKIDPRPGTGRPSTGDVDDFLGIHRPNKPTTRPGTLPGNLPGTPGNRPGKLPGDIAGNRPETRPNRPPFVPPTAKPGINDKGWWNSGHIGDKAVYNPVINTRPSWAGSNVNINNKWQNSFNRPGWGTRPNYGYWNHWGNNFRHHWGHYNHYHNWYNHNWWYSHRYPLAGWNYGYAFYSYPYSYWWSQPTWPAVSSWFSWSNAPAAVWQQPVYYTYGSGGNVQYVNNMVSIGGEEIATPEEFAQSAATLATVDPPAPDLDMEQVEWMPLGTFAVTTGEKDLNSGRSIQLAVSKDGIISGTAYNVDNDKAQSIQGRVDKETQRVAFRIGDNENFVAETGIYNLTQNEAPLLVHFGKERVENWLLVRLDAPEDATSTDSNR